MTLVEELGMIVGKWFVQLAPIRRWYFPLCIYIILFILFFNLNLYFVILINQTELWTILACPSLTGRLDESDMERTKSSTISRNVPFSTNFAVDRKLLAPPSVDNPGILKREREREV